jgi:hypothetical protein
VLHGVEEERNILQTIKIRKANWIGHILRRNYLVKHVIEGKIEGRVEMTGRRGRREERLSIFSLDFFTLEDGTDTLSRNVGKGLPLDAA